MVLDNATFHKGGLISQLIKEAECRVLYLPPYSPEKNKIEQCWSWIKSQIYKVREKFDCLHDAVKYVLSHAC